MPSRTIYSLGLSSFPLLAGETTIAAGTYLKNHRDAATTRGQLQSSNLLQRKHYTTSIVATREVVKRLAHADEWELDTLAENHDFSDSSFLCTLLVSRQYPILLELVRDLIKYKFDGKDKILRSYEIESWYRDFLDSHQTRKDIKESSFQRLLINTRQIFKEGGLLSATIPEKFTIHRPRISISTQSYYENLKKQENLEMLLLSNHQIRRIMEY